MNQRTNQRMNQQRDRQGDRQGEFWSRMQNLAFNFHEKLNILDFYKWELEQFMQWVFRVLSNLFNVLPDGCCACTDVCQGREHLIWAYFASFWLLPYLQQAPHLILLLKVFNDHRYTPLNLTDYLWNLDSHFVCYLVSFIWWLKFQIKPRFSVRYEISNTHLFLFVFSHVHRLILPWIIWFPDTKSVGQINI